VRLWWRKRRRKARPGDCIRLDGKLYMVVEVTWPQQEATLEPLGSLLANWMAASDDAGVPILIFDLLVDAGWTPPDTSRRVMGYS